MILENVNKFLFIFTKYRFFYFKNSNFITYLSNYFLILITYATNKNSRAN